MVPRGILVSRGRLTHLARHLASGVTEPQITKDDFVEISGQSLSRGDAYRFLISACVPRPIAFISTIGNSGVRNLSPYSFFNIVATEPPTLAFGHVTRAQLPGGMSDTLRNIIETKSCVVQLISASFLEAANHTCGPYDYDIDEIALAGLSTLPGDTGVSDRIAESLVQCECELRETYKIRNENGDVSSTVCILSVKKMHANRHIMKHDMSDIDFEKLEPMSRLGGDTYGYTGGILNGSRENGFASSIRPPFNGTAPNPQYKPGEKVNLSSYSIKADAFVNVDSNDSKIGRYLTSALVPRPSFIIATCSKAGERRLSCHSFLNGVGSDPLTIMFSVDKTSETYRNIKETGYCVLHGISSACYDFASRFFSVKSGDVVDEIEFLEGSSQYFTWLTGSGDENRFIESPLHLVCFLEETYEIGSSRLCFLTVNRAFVEKSIYDRNNKQVWTEMFSPISRISSDKIFGQVGGTFDLPRPNRDGSEGKLRF